MLPELGFIALLMASTLSALQCILPGTGLFLKRKYLASSAAPLAYGSFLLYFAAMAILIVSLLNDDFSVAYVAQHSNSRLPVFFKLAAAWGGHEGSILLFVLTLSLWSALVAVFSRKDEQEITTHVLIVLGGLTAAFAFFTVLTSDPFSRMFPPPFEGRDLNPMLQDIALIFHPPLLYIGYAGFAVSFAYAMAALLTRNMDRQLLRRERAWSVAAWIFLTGGIALGAWWAYFELGWGGWWFWDPVENASLMPWLLGTALLHVLAVTEKRGVFELFALLLSIFTFSFSMLGTFIVRSGVLSSVHAFANDPGRGIALLLILSGVSIIVLCIFALRADLRPSTARFAVLSKENALAATGALFCVMTACVMIGTFYPLIYNILGLGALSVGAPYFNSVFTPLCLIMLLLLPFGPALQWGEMPKRWLRAQFPWLLIGGGIGTWLCLRQPLPANAVTLALCVLSGWVIVSHIAALLRSRSLAQAGVYLCHIGVAVAIIGASHLAQYTQERWLSMDKGKSYPLGNLSFILESSEPLIGPNFTAEQLIIRVEENGKPVAILRPERRYYNVRATSLREPGVEPKPGGDLYATFGDKIGPDSYTVHIQYKPMASWLWFGAGLMILGGFLRFGGSRSPQTRQD